MTEGSLNNNEAALRVDNPVESKVGGAGGNKRIRKELSPIDKKAANKLKKIWLAFKERKNITQEQAAKQMDWTQGNFSQYVNGNARIGDSALRSFCDYLGCRVFDIREEYADPNILSQVNQLKSVLGKMISMLESTEGLDSEEAKSLIAEARLLAL